MSARGGKRKFATIDLTSDGEIIDLTSDTKEPHTSASSSKECPVCMDILGTEGAPQALGCLHVFCRGCIAQCIRTQAERMRQPDCPVCKRVIPAEEQRACGVDLPAEGAAYTHASIDMFSPHDEAEIALSREVAEMRARVATFSHVPVRNVWQSRASDSMHLLDRHMQRQRTERQPAAGASSNHSHQQQHRGRGTDAGGPPRPGARGAGGRSHGPRSRHPGVSWP